MIELATYSRLATLRHCPRKHYLRYEIGLTRDTDADYLRTGGAFHKGRELLNRGAPRDEAIWQAVASYDTPPLSVEPYDWQVERETVVQLLVGHAWRYERDELEIVAPELPFRVPLRNPDTGAPSRSFMLAGRIDAIVRLPDGRLAVLEYKTAGEDVGPDSDYWLRLRGDAQISTYMLAARDLGHDVATVLYDVTRKPTIRPHQIPLLDEHGDKIVLDARGERVFTKQGKPRQTTSVSDGYVLQTRPETPEEYGARLIDDITQRPDYYFQRREVPRSDDDLLECQYEIWHQAQQLLDMRRHGRWYRNVTRQCANCEFAGLCLNNVHVTPDDVPSGFVILENVHPELEGAFDDAT